MRITKIGHCCLLLEENGMRLLIDPGSYSSGQNEEKSIDAVLITHEHPDHLHIESVESILRNNPNVAIFTNKGVGKILKEADISYTLLENGEKTIFRELSLEGFGSEHAYIYDTVPVVQNTGYLVAEKFFYPGDAFYHPKRPVDVLALPVAGPWMRIADAIEYAKTLKPRICFPVHDGMLYPDHRLGPVHRLPAAALPPLGISFVPMTGGMTYEF